MREPRGRKGALAAAFLTALVAAVFADAFTTARVFFRRDIHAYWYPHMAVVRRAVAEGSWPLWNPFVGFGAPLLADATFQLAYPPTWLAIVLAPALHLKLMAIGHCLLAAFGAAALVRRFGLGWTAAGAAGAAYALSGPFLSAANLFHHYAGAAWLPWLLLALEDLIRRPGPASALWLGLVAGAQMLAGSGDMCLAGATLGTARLGWLLAREHPGSGRLLSLAGSGALAATLALALGAMQWLPTAERAREGSRAEQDPRTNTFWSLHPASLVDMAVPRLVADLPLSAQARGEVFEGREPLLACALPRPRPRRPRRARARLCAGASRRRRGRVSLLRDRGPGSAHACLRLPPGSAGLRPHALPTEVPSSRGVVPGRHGRRGGRSLGRGLVDSRRGAGAASWPHCCCWRPLCSSPRRGGSPGPRTP